jgi:hypothetical protein
VFVSMAWSNDHLFVIQQESFVIEILYDFYNDRIEILAE